MPDLTASIFKQTVPCADCPFRKTGGVRHSASMLSSYISYFTTGSRITFPCHASVPDSDSRTDFSPWQDGQVICAGGLLFAAKFGWVSNIVLFGMVKGWYDPCAHRPEALALVFDSGSEMLRGAP